MCLKHHELYPYGFHQLKTKQTSLGAWGVPLPTWRHDRFDGQTILRWLNSYVHADICSGSDHGIYWSGEFLNTKGALHNLFTRTGDKPERGHIVVKWYEQPSIVVLRSSFTKPASHMQILISLPEKKHGLPRGSTSTCQNPCRTNGNQL